MSTIGLPQEHRAQFEDTAERRYTAIVASGKTVAWAEMRRYLEHRVAGKKTVRPKPRALAR